MSKSLKTLPAEYPRVFRNINPERHGGEFYTSCGDGWGDLITSLVAVIDWKLGRWEDVREIQAGIKTSGKPEPEWIAEYFKKTPNNPLDTFEILQVKEKFGGLRFYYGGITGENGEFVDGAVHMAESLSRKLCERCGNTSDGKQVPGVYWMKTLCEAHKEKEILKREAFNKRVEEKTLADVQQQKQKEEEGSKERSLGEGTAKGSDPV